MKTDSVFDTALYQEGMPIPFEDDKTILPVKVITDAWDRIAEEAIAAQVDVLEEETTDLLRRAEPLIQDKNLDAIANLTWRANVTLQAPIYQVWENGYTLGADHGHREMLVSLPNNYNAMPGERYALPAAIKRAIEALLTLTPPAFLNSNARQAVLQRVIYLAGNFSNSIISQFRQSIIAAIVPQPNTGYPITRKELLDQLQSTLSVGRLRAEAIARTELTNAYNTGRIASFQQSELVEYVRFLAITDNRTTTICTSRNGMLIPISEREAIAANTPPLHVNCRSTCSPVMPKVNKRHKAWVDDPERDWSNRELTPLPKGWNS